MIFLALRREGLPRTWSNPQLSSHIRPGLEPPRLQQAAFDDCVYALDVMRNVAVKQEAGAERAPERLDALEAERKLSLPVRALNDQASRSDSNSSHAQQAVAGRLEIRMLHERPGQPGSAPGPTLYRASTPNQNESLPAPVEETTVFYDAQPADEETFKTAKTLVQPTESETERLETVRDDNDESFQSPAPSRPNVASPQHRKIGTVVPPAQIEARDDGEDDDDEDEEESEEKEKPRQDYEILSEEVDEECRKISVINLNDLSAAFEASSRLSARTPPAETTRRYSHDEASRRRSEDESDQRHDDEAGGRRRRQGVEKYISDNSQLNLQFERRRSHRPSSTDVAALRDHQMSMSRHRSSLGVGPELGGVYAPLPASAYLESSSSRLSRPSSAQHAGSLAPPSSYEINRVRSSPSIAPSSSGRFPFHYAPHPPTGNPPTLRELDAR